MIKLIKYKKGTNNENIKEPELISKFGEPEMQDCGLLLKFKGKNARHPDYAVLFDNDDVRKMVDKMLVHLSKQ